jgi:preprotein translocase subunit SecG
MLYEILVGLFIFNNILLVLLILIQQGKGNMGLGSLGGSAQMLFGGSGGQDILQKITWVLGTLFMVGSLGLSLMKAQQLEQYTYRSARAPMTQSAPAQLPSSSNNQ